jgi:hypothetical protein
MIVDVFPFFNEYEILKIRLELLHPFVDKFVIVEHDIDFNNNKKSFNLDLIIDLLNKKYKNKIDYVKLHSNPIDGVWGQEIYQKNNLSYAIELYPDAYFLFGDLDEIPNPEFLKEAIELYNKSGPCLFFLDWCINRWDIVMKKEWPGPVFGKKEDVIKAGGVRKFMCPGDTKSKYWVKSFYPSLNHSGWHFSYFGDTNTVSKKLDAVIEGSKVRKKIKNEKEVIENGQLIHFIKKYAGEFYDKLPDNFYSITIKNIISGYPEWWQDKNRGE